MPAYDQVAIVGVGLLGGSIGLALKQQGLASEVIGIGRDDAKLEAALKQGIVDRVTTDLAEGVQAAEIVVVCTPVELIASTVAEVLQKAPETCLVTDVGSTKESIVRQVLELAPDEAGSRFVGSHPLAGGHRTGADFANAELFAGKLVIVTPPESVGEDTPSDAATRIAAFWKAMGANVVTLLPDEHDAAVAITSHLPHVVASALANATPSEILKFAATGWADTTRVAAANADLWRQIFLSNRDQVLAALDHFDHHLTSLRQAIADRDGDKIEQLLAEGKRIRDAVGN